MHPMERQKVKNNTGFITNYSLDNCEIIEGIDFKDNQRFNSLFKGHNNLYLLFPFENSEPICRTNIDKKSDHNIFIIIDSTWPLAKKILKLNPKLKECIPITFEKKHHSQYQIKLQPKDGFISTMETAQVLLHELNQHKIEQISTEEIDAFIKPFLEINKYQVNCKNDPLKPRYKSRMKND
jgi:DTW domain-containing protein YfiP